MGKDMDKLLVNYAEIIYKILSGQVKLKTCLLKGEV